MMMIRFECIQFDNEPLEFIIHCSSVIVLLLQARSLPGGLSLLIFLIIKNIYSIKGRTVLYKGTCK